MSPEFESNILFFFLIEINDQPPVRHTFSVLTMWHHVSFLFSEQADPQTPLPFIRSVTVRLAEVEKAGHANSDRLK